ncbi:S1 family peptidase [Leadbettera azotonutricia]|uniref:Putative lipoprotein n=1 Tax=Leadbettera azotonutricia (strain ATCC BAA-888 / DSM 13862 / ZAS-9) TaxID=545695 RepID=F5YAJ0_LEAAZ|nr:serine protease [Leadbettera azotonutricia]AEF83436.1 putative lipoprotein [Leadbettera azotonutricia ZAS-9]
MKKNLSRLAIIAAAIALAISCASSPGGQSGSGLPSKTLALVQNAVFEVVLEKPADDPVTYDKELDWEKVPYAIRTDKYYSIGTAFAISRTELITAFHVINLGYESLTYTKYFVRDSQGQVYEVDTVNGGSNERDYLIFTVKDKTFDQFFQFERNYKTGDPVYSIGNALGEGIVVRNGLVLGTIPEEESGRWNLLKSSADGNPGNSGGPLVTPAGKVIALVTALRDNILYSTPAEVILDDSKDSLAYRHKNRFGHLILANKLNNTFETQAALPSQYLDVRANIRSAYEKNYDASMSKLFAEAPEYLTGPNNSYILSSSLSSTFPELAFVDSNDDNWKLSGLEKKSYNLPDNGRLTHAQVGGYDFYKIKKPLSVSIEKACTDPKYIQDLILQTIRTERTLWGNDKYRILSYGAPAAVGEYKDALGRTWITANWHVDFDDEVQIVFILPLPNGPVVVSCLKDSAFLMDYEWDMKKTCDHAFAAYDANFTEWDDFLTLKKYIPDFLKSLTFNWSAPNKNFVFKCGPVSINADANVFEWAYDSEIFLAPTWYKKGGKLEYGVRKIIIDRDVRGNDFLVLYRNIKPDPILGTSALENWNDLLQEKFPFDEKPAISVKDNTGSVGAIVKAQNVDPDVRFSLYFSMENPQGEGNLSQRLTALKSGLTITD